MKSIREICQTIVAACILHSICIIEHDLLEDLLYENEPDAFRKEMMVLHCLRMMQEFKKENKHYK